MRYGLLLFLLGLAFSVNAEIYQWQDDKGNVHFTDLPQPGAVAIDIGADATIAESDRLSTANKSAGTLASPATTQKPGVSQAATPAGTTTTDSSNATSSPSAITATAYTQVKILQPQNEASFFSNEGRIDLLIETKPALKEADKAIVLIDGKASTTTLKDNLLSVTGIDRGTHTAQVQIVNHAEQVLQKSNTITFYMRKASLNSPANKT